MLLLIGYEAWWAFRHSGKNALILRTIIVQSGNFILSFTLKSRAALGILRRGEKDHVC
jgi:hypothetical protein